MGGFPTGSSCGLYAELKAEYARRKAENDWPEEAPCFWLDQSSGRCKHHEQRPEICREFEVGGESCLMFRKEHGVGEPRP